MKSILELNERLLDIPIEIIKLQEEDWEKNIDKITKLWKEEDEINRKLREITNFYLGQFSHDYSDSDEE